MRTTIETHLITEITFPKIAVCPPKNTYTDLNYDLMMAENMTLDNNTRKELFYNAIKILYDHLCETNFDAKSMQFNTFQHNCTELLFEYVHKSILTNMSLLVDNDRYYNWYHGYTQIKLPLYGSIKDYTNNDYGFYDKSIMVYTSASSGSVYTQYFAENIDEDKFDLDDFWFNVQIYPPASAKNDTNVTLHLKLESKTSEDDQIYIGDESSSMELSVVQEKSIQHSESYAVKYLLKRDSNYWLARDCEAGFGKGFTLDFGRYRSFNLLQLVNSNNKWRSTKDFKVYVDVDGSWVEVINGTLEDGRNLVKLPIQEFSFPTITGRFVRFDLMSFYGSGGGLQFFYISNKGNK